MPGLFNLKGRHLITLIDYTGEEIRHIIETGLLFKRRYYSGERVIPVLKGRTIAMIFEKHSTRTRVSFSVAAAQLGAEPLYLGWNELQLGRGETIADTARVLSRYVDAIVARVKRHETLEELARYSSVPVINALSNLTHPAQALGDYMTILEKKGKLQGIRLAFVGDGSDNVLHSLLLAGAKLGVNIVVASPRELRPDPRILKAAEEAAAASGASIEFTVDPVEAVRGADVVYTDVWVSMGQEAEAEKRIQMLRPYQVNERLMREAGPQALFMHCLPAMRGMEVTDDVIDGPQSIVWDQAENRLHVQKAILALLVR
ncbi:MAG: ornithine carbamoyltransferase [Desulfurococcales archaeon]|nr:ornithine carbamoyltransferase [Desulfurococcales archaeon]